MKTYPFFKDNNGHPFAFEIDNMDVWYRGITNLLGKIEGVTAIQIKKKFFSGSDDVRVEFKYNDIGFVVWEPYGDSSRYWIGPENDKDIGIDITGIESSFRQLNPSVTPKVVMWIIFGIVLLLMFWEEIGNVANGYS